MTLKEAIKKYIEEKGDTMNHTFKDGSEVKNQRLSSFLINWHNQAIDEFERYGTTKNAETIKKLIS